MSKGGADRLIGLYEHQLLELGVHRQGCKGDIPILRSSEWRSGFGSSFVNGSV